MTTNWMDATRSKPVEDRPVIVRRDNGETRIAAWRMTTLDELCWLCCYTSAVLSTVMHWASLPVILGPDIGGMTVVTAAERDDIPAAFLDHYTFRCESYSWVGVVPTVRANAWAKGMAERAGDSPPSDQVTGEQQRGDATNWMNATRTRPTVGKPALVRRANGLETRAAKWELMRPDGSSGWMCLSSGMALSDVTHWTPLLSGPTRPVVPEQPHKTLLQWSEKAVELVVRRLRNDKRHDLAQILELNGGAIRDSLAFVFGDCVSETTAEFMDGLKYGKTLRPLDEEAMARLLKRLHGEGRHDLANILAEVVTRPDRRGSGVDNRVCIPVISHSESCFRGSDGGWLRDRRIKDRRARS